MTSVKLDLTLAQSVWRPSYASLEKVLHSVCTARDWQDQLQAVEMNNKCFGIQKQNVSKNNSFVISPQSLFISIRPIEYESAFNMEIYEGIMLRG